MQLPVLLCSSHQGQQHPPQIPVCPVLGCKNAVTHFDSCSNSFHAPILGLLPFIRRLLLLLQGILEAFVGSCCLEEIAQGAEQGLQIICNSWKHKGFPAQGSHWDSDSTRLINLNLSWFNSRAPGLDLFPLLPFLLYREAASRPEGRRKHPK